MQNINIGRLHDPKAFDFGHYDVWIIDRLQTLSKEVYDNPENHLFPTWVNNDSFESTGESFGIVEVEESVRLVYNILPCLEKDAPYLCRRMNTKFPILPVHTKEERTLFRDFF
jgi:hypothetical protein